eukprot:1205683-Prymnesium_polylepis.2
MLQRSVASWKPPARRCYSRSTAVSGVTAERASATTQRRVRAHLLARAHHVFRVDVRPRLDERRHDARLGASCRLVKRGVAHLRERVARR